MNPAKIGNRLVGPGQPTVFVTEIGINHNGDIDLAKKLVVAAASVGCDARWRGGAGAARTSAAEPREPVSSVASPSWR